MFIEKLSSPLYKEDMDNMHCENCDSPGREDPLILRSRCHPKFKPDVYYYNDQIVVMCPCGKIVTNIAVAVRSK